MYKIAVLDEELKEREEFFNYFEIDFVVTEMPVINNIDEFVSFIKHEKIDAIAIDYKLKDHGSSFEFNGDYFFKEINKRLLDFPAFILTNDPNHAKRQSPSIIPFYIIDKNRIILTDSSLRKDILSYISNYKAKVEASFARIKELSIIRKERGLSTKEEEEYIDNNLYVERIVDNETSSPKALYSTAVSDKLSDLISKSESLLKKLTPDA
jgi:hypothetical protein